MIYKLFMCEDFTESSCSRFCSELDEIYKKINKGDELLITIDSNGGVVFGLLHIMNTLDLMKKKKKVRITTYNKKKAYSCGAVLFSAGQDRIIHPTADILVHQVSYGVRGPHHEIQRAVEEANEVNLKLFKIMSINTKIPIKKLLKRCETEDWVFDSKEAVDLKFATDIDII